MRFREEVRNEQETTHAGADHHGASGVGGVGVVGGLVGVVPLSPHATSKSTAESRM